MPEPPALPVVRAPPQVPSLAGNVSPASASSSVPADVVSRVSTSPVVLDLSATALAPHVSSQGVPSGSRPTPLHVSRGPPTDLSLEKSSNFALRKAFHGVGGFPPDASFAVPSPAVTHGAKPSPSSSPIRPVLQHSFLDATPKSPFSAQAESQFDRPPGPESSINMRVPAGTSPPHDPSQVPPVVTPARVLPYSPKPMISFEISKWTKEMKDITVEDESYDALISWYDFIQQAMIIATGRSNIMPELQDLTKLFVFSSHILPHKISSVYKAGLLEYVSMAKALRIHILKPGTISKTCTQLIEKRDLHKNERDGFTLLLTVLGAVFPHLGGPHLDVISEISSIQVLHRFMNMERKLTLAGHQVPATALFQRYLSLVKTNQQIFALISPIQRHFHEHLRIYGPDVRFPRYSIPDVHEYIKASGIDTESIIMKHTSSSFQKKSFSQAHQANQIIVPQASAAVYDPSLDVQGPSPPMVLPTYGHNACSPQANAAAMAQNHALKPYAGRRSEPCPVCYQRHPPLRCWARGLSFQPLWLQRNVAKYNALHNSDVIDEQYKNQPPPLRRAQVSAQANKSVSFSNMEDVGYSTNVSHTPPLLHSPPPPSSSHLSHIPGDDTSLLSRLSDQEYNQSVSNPVCNMAQTQLQVSENDDLSFIEA